MKPDERVLDYTERIKEIKLAIIDVKTKESGELSNLTLRRIENEVLDALDNGLPGEYELRIKHERYHDLTSAENAFLNISRALERNRARIGKGGPKEITRVRVITKETCTICKRTGHTDADCRNKQRLLTFAEVTSRPSSPRGKDPKKNQGSNSRPSSPKKQRTCYYCKKVGHILKDYRKLRYNSENRSMDKRSTYISGRRSSVSHKRSRRSSKDYERKYRRPDSRNSERRSPSSKSRDDRKRRNSTSSHQENFSSGLSRLNRSEAATEIAHPRTTA